MFIWKYIDIDQSEIDRITSICLAARSMWSNRVGFFQHLDLGVKEFLGRPVFKTVLITAAPNSTGSIHTDYREDNTVLAINIPLLNCDNAITEFWESSLKKPVAILSPGGTTHFSWGDNTNCRKIDEYQLSKPVIFNTGVLHSVNNFSNEQRIAISIRLVTDPWDLVGEV